jgi:hypothetical protein
MRSGVLANPPGQVGRLAAVMRPDPHEGGRAAAAIIFVGVASAVAWARRLAG